MSQQPPEDQNAAESSGQDPHQPGATPPPSYSSPEQPSATPPPAYGSPPPPPSAYPSPSQGGFPPAPPPGPGASGQYGPPGPGYGSPGAYGTTGEPQATDSLSRGWQAFKANPWPFVLSQLAWGAIFVALTLILAAAFGLFSTDLTVDPETGEVEGNPGFIGLGFFGFGVFALVLIALSVIQMGAFASATIKTVDGGRADFADFFKPRNPVQLLLLSLILAVVSAVLAITVIGILIVLFFGIWAIFFVVDRNQSAIESIKSSVTFSSRNVGQTIVLILLGYVLNAIGALLCGIGTLITNPVTLLAYADFYRRVTGPSGRQDAPGAPQYG